MKQSGLYFNLRWLVTFALMLLLDCYVFAANLEPDKITRQQLEKYILEFGLEKKSALSEFWDKSKYYYSGSVYNDIDYFVEQNQNIEISKPIVDSIKTTEGEVPLIKLTLDGKEKTIQFYAEQNKWVKIDNVVLSLRDLLRPEDAFARLEASNIKLKRESESYRHSQKSVQLENQTQALQLLTSYQLDFSKFEDFPRMTPALWKSLPVVDRVSFILKMRLLWQNAHFVLESVLPSEKDKFKIDKTSSSIRINGKTTIIPAENNTCIFAGYIGKQVGNETEKTNKSKNLCIIDGIENAFNVDNVADSASSTTSATTTTSEAAIAASSDTANSTNQISKISDFMAIQEANDFCAKEKGVGFVACNPILYSFPNGKESCINHIQTTTELKSCENNKNDLKDYVKIKSREKLLLEIEKDQKSEESSLSEQYLKGILTKKNKAFNDVFEVGEWPIEFDNELVKMQNQFEVEIAKAKLICSSGYFLQTEKSKKILCDLLHQRFLSAEKFLTKFFEKSCLAPSLFVSNSISEDKDKDKDKIVANCDCPYSNIEGQNIKIEAGATCASTLKTELANAGATNSETVTIKCDKPTGIAGFDYDRCSCYENKKLLQIADGNYQCEGKSWLPWALNGSSMVLATAILFRHTKAKMPPEVPGQCPTGKTGTAPNNCVCANKCASGSILNPVSCSCDTIPNVALCAAPTIGTPPNCGCPASASFCAGSQKIYNLSTCQCTDVPQPIACPNNETAPSGNIALCPKCANGSFVPIAGCPTEGGVGHSCPQGGCSGGLPKILKK